LELLTLAHGSLQFRCLQLPQMSRIISHTRNSSIRRSLRIQVCKRSEFYDGPLTSAPGSVTS